MSWLLKTIVTVNWVVLLIFCSRLTRDIYSLSSSSSSSFSSSSGISASASGYLQRPNNSLNTIETRTDVKLPNFNNSREPASSNILKKIIVDNKVPERQDEDHQTLENVQDDETNFLCPNQRIDDQFSRPSNLPENNLGTDEKRNVTKEENGSDRPSYEEKNDHDPDDEGDQQDDVDNVDEEPEEEEEDYEDQLYSYSSVEDKIIPEVEEETSKIQEDSLSSCFGFGDANIVIKILINGGQDCGEVTSTIVDASGMMKSSGDPSSIDGENIFQQKNMKNQQMYKDPKEIIDNYYNNDKMSMIPFKEEKNVNDYGRNIDGDYIYPNNENYDNNEYDYGSAIIHQNENFENETRFT